VIRALITSLALTDLDHRLRCFVVTSPRRGRTTEAACSIAGGLARDGHRVVLIGRTSATHRSAATSSSRTAAPASPACSPAGYLDDVFIPRLDSRLAVLPPSHSAQPAAVLGSQLMSSCGRSRAGSTSCWRARLLDDAGTADIGRRGAGPDHRRRDRLVRRAAPRGRSSPAPSRRSPPRTAA
jgi:hypothetical protein